MFKKNMNYQSLDALKTVEPIINKAAEAVKDPTKITVESAAPGIVGIVGGGTIGGIIVKGLIYDFGTVGLSAPGITSGFKALGFGRSIMTGLGVAGAIVSASAGGGFLFINHATNKKLLQEKERICKAAVNVYDALINELNANNKLPSDQIKCLNKHNALLQDVIEKLKADLESKQ